MGRELELGNAVRLDVSLLDPRCVMTTLAQGDLPQDTEVLRTLVRHNRVELPGLGQYPCAGAYAVVTSPGGVRVGDSVRTQKGKRISPFNSEFLAAFLSRDVEASGARIHLSVGGSGAPVLLLHGHRRPT